MPAPRKATEEESVARKTDAETRGLRMRLVDDNIRYRALEVVQNASNIPTTNCTIKRIIYGVFCIHLDYNVPGERSIRVSPILCHDRRLLICGQFYTILKKTA